eukprot:6455056-Amphidinium_carterae.5
MQSISSISHVRFIHLFRPNLPASDRFALCYKLLAEELSEIQQTSGEGDVTELADGLGDLLYVLIGTVLECGLHDALLAILQEIHRSNMTKFCPTVKHAQVACNEHFLQHGIVTYPVCGLNGMYAICRHDGTVGGMIMMGNGLVCENSPCPEVCGQRRPGVLSTLRGDVTVRANDNLTNDEILAALCPRDHVSLDNLAFLSCLDSWGLNANGLNDIDPAWYPDREVHRSLQSTPLVCVGYIEFVSKGC